MSGSTLHLAEQLIARASVTPADAGCQELIAQRLQAVGFQCETIVSGPADFLLPICGQNGLQPSSNIHMPLAIR